MTERWKPIPSYEGYYSVSNQGQVFSARAQKILSPGVLAGGYEQVQLVVAKKRVQAKVHRLVAQAFLGAPPTPRHQVAHNNGDPSDNSVSNLRWATPAENQADRKLHGTASVGEANYRAKVTEADVLAIRDSPKSRADLARTYGLSWTQIEKIRSRKSWRHI